jgi:type II secretory pathway pseudopilin PulG
MGRTSSLTAGRRYRRARRLRHERHGVVAVIGTLLALLVFFALFGIFLTQYVPLWMTDNESQLTAQAETSFAQFKSAVDAQYTLDGPQSYGSPFVISSAGVPLIAQPTEGTLLFLPSICPGGFFTKGITPHENATNNGQPVNPGYCVFLNVTESIGPGGSGPVSQSVASGTLQLVLPNRYFNPETFYFEDDAVIQSQSVGYQVIGFPPPLNITNIGGNTTVTDSFLQLYGNASTVVGQGSEEVYSHLRYSDTINSNGLLVGTTYTPLKFTYVMGTQYPCAWAPYLYKVITTSGVSSANYALSTVFDGVTTTPLSAHFPGSCFDQNGATTVLSFSISSVDYATLYQAGIQIGLGVGST